MDICNTKEPVRCWHWDIKSLDFVAMAVSTLQTGTQQYFATEIWRRQRGDRTSIVLLIALMTIPTQTAYP